MSGRPVLVADIGGTNARFALADVDGDAGGDAGAGPLLRTDTIRAYPVAAFQSLADTARRYLADVDAAPTHAVMAVAAHLDGDEVRITNHPWTIPIAPTRAALGLQTLDLVNDFAAQAMAITRFDAADVIAIGGGSRGADDGDRTYAVIGPGTGLGVGALLRRGGRWHALQTEGGHVGFAPGTAEEIAILQVLSAEYGRVSAERVVSGMGLSNVHRALAEIAGDEPATMAPAEIAARAAAGDARAARTIAVFCAAFGACAGDLVLTLGAWDGCFLAGGLVPRLLPALQRSEFRRRFEDKGRFAAAIAAVPTLAVVHPQPGLLGAAAIAADARKTKTG